jgi:peptide-methionine (S)-S-oxide reductase
MSSNIEVAVFANGCFWCTEAVFSQINGVTSVLPGYTDGISRADIDPVKGPTYEQVSSGMTGYVECIKIEYDPYKVDYNDLLAVFFNTHDPTTVNRQGNDIGTQYRSAIFYTTEEQRESADRLIKELNRKEAYDKPVVTDLKPLTTFYVAEDYHHTYYKNHEGQPYCQLVIAPKLEKLQKRFANLLK